MLTPNGPSLLSKLTIRARAHRSEATRSEATLWSALRMRKLGVRVRRQHPLAPYIVDFFVPSHRLVIEVDNGYHLSSEQVAADARRDAELVRLHGVQVVRFDAALVLVRPASVVAAIRGLLR